MTCVLLLRSLRGVHGNFSENPFASSIQRWARTAGGFIVHPVRGVLTLSIMWMKVLWSYTKRTLELEVMLLFRVSRLPSHVVEHFSHLHFPLRECLRQVFRFTFFLLFFMVMFTIYSVPPLHLVRDIYLSFSQIQRRLHAFYRCGIFNIMLRRRGQ